MAFKLVHLSVRNLEGVQKKVVLSFSSVFDVSQNVIQAIVFYSHCMTYPAAISPHFFFFKLIGPCLAY